MVRIKIWQKKKKKKKKLVQYLINSLRPRQNGRHFSDDIFKWIFVNGNIWISINISLELVRKGLINNTPALVLITAWHRPGDQPLSEPMLVISLNHICVTRPQWVKLCWSLGLPRYDTVECRYNALQRYTLTNTLTQWLSQIRQPLISQ